MTEQEKFIDYKMMAQTCESYHSCGACPYNPEDLTEFIGERWKGGCPNYDRLLVYALGKGYRKEEEVRKELIEELHSITGFISDDSEELSDKMTFYNDECNKYGSSYRIINEYDYQKLLKRLRISNND